MRLPFEPGQRTRRVTVQFRRDGQSTSSFPVDNWDVVRSAVIPMAREDVSGTEADRGHQAQSAYQTRWYLAYRCDMDPELVDVTKDRRLVWQTRVHDIVSGVVVGMRDAIELRTVANPSGETVS